MLILIHTVMSWRSVTWDKNADWFLFGRSQGIQNSGLKKIVFKHIIDKNKPQIKPFILDEDVVVYSGRYITAETEEDLQKAYNIFKSEEFARYWRPWSERTNPAGMWRCQRKQLKSLEYGKSSRQWKAEGCFL